MEGIKMGKILKAREPQGSKAPELKSKMLTLIAKKRALIAKKRAEIKTLQYMITISTFKESK